MVKDSKEGVISRLSWKGNVYVALMQSLTLVMLLYSISRLGFYFFNISFFPDMTWKRMALILYGGLRFDLSATLYSNSLFILLMILPTLWRFRNSYQKLLKWIFILVNGLAFAINTADFIYYRFTLRRTTLSVVSQFENEQNLISLFFRFLFDYWYAVLFFIVILFILIKGFSRIRYNGPQITSKIYFYGTGVAALALSVGLFIGGARGGFRSSTRPITLSNAAAYAKVPKDINLVLNTPFAIMRTAKAGVIEKVNYFANNDSLNKVFNPLIIPGDSLPFQSKNVVILILESFSKEFIGAYNPQLDSGKYKGYAPFLDSLISLSYSYQYSLANGRKSIDAMPSVICSIPSIEVPYVLSHFSGNKVNSLATLLSQKGYHTAFFHGAPNGSMGFDAFANLCGFDEYYGKSEYNNNQDFDGIWGVWDEPFLQFFARKMESFKQPFYTTIFTVSSHHPYNLPPLYESRFAGGPKLVHKTIQYTDFSLKRFFKTASQMPWFKNTIFVITADHASAEIQEKEYNSAWGYFSIPVLFYVPGEKGEKLKDEIIQQIDIMPTILGMLHYDKPYIAFGRDAFHDRKEPIAFNYLDNNYQAFEGNYLLQFDGKKSIALFDFKSDKFLRNNLVGLLPDSVRRIETRLKGFIQQYNNRMVDDDLTPEGPQSNLKSVKLK